MRHAYVTFAAALLPLAVFAADATVAKNEWFSCDKDRDCGRSERICGEPQAVNLKHYHEYRDYLDAMRPSTHCDAPRKVMNLRELRSICIANQCGFDQALKYGDE